MSKTMIVAAALALASTMALTPAAEARVFGRAVMVQVAGGHGYFRSRTVNRTPGSTAVTRDFQSNSGRGMATSRTANWGNGSYSGGATHTLNNGDSFGRSTTATSNGDGTANYTTTHTGINGQTTTVSGTVSRQ